jgi:hypothetical protein
MPKAKGRTAKALLADYRALPRDQQQQVLRQLLGQPPPCVWMTQQEAATLLGKHKAAVTRLVKQGELVSNGKGRGKYRVLAADVILIGLQNLRDAIHSYCRQWPKDETALYWSGKLPLLEQDIETLTLERDRVQAIESLQSSATGTRSR